MKTQLMQTVENDNDIPQADKQLVKSEIPSKVDYVVAEAAKPTEAGVLQRIR